MGNTSPPLLSCILLLGAATPPLQHTCVHVCTRVCWRTLSHRTCAPQGQGPELVLPTALSQGNSTHTRAVDECVAPVTAPGRLLISIHSGRMGSERLRHWATMEAAVRPHPTAMFGTTCVHTPLNDSPRRKQLPQSRETLLWALFPWIPNRPAVRHTRVRRAEGCGAAGTFWCRL